MKTVFIFGAGASKQAGAPLMSDFLDCAYDLLRKGNTHVAEAKSEFEDVFSAIAELQSVHSKSYLNLDNLEIVFGAIEMGILIKRLGKRKIGSINKLRNSFITLIYKTLEYSIRFPVNNQRYAPPRPYGLFLDRLKNLDKNNEHSDKHQFSFITFNYDLCLDVALHLSNRRYDYFLGPKFAAGSCPLLKLHGSINWGRTQDNKISAFEIKKAHFFDLFDTHHVFFALGSKLSQQELKGPPIIVPPTWNKNSFHGQLSRIWSIAAGELTTAENIFIIGYSLPETDSFFRYLFALSANNKTRIRNFIVINPDQSGAVENRFYEFIGRGIQNRFRYISKTFEKGIEDIFDVLNTL